MKKKIKYRKKKEEEDSDENFGKKFLINEVNKNIKIIKRISL